MNNINNPLEVFQQEAPEVSKAFDHPIESLVCVQTKVDFC
jgi:hypothetical protein